MSNEEELLFPSDLLKKRLASGGNMYGWRLEDIPSVVQTCRDLGFAILGSETEFFLPDGTCELIWLRTTTRDRETGESWTHYVESSCSQFTQLFDALTKRTDFEKEGVEFDFLREKKAAGVNILDYLCFEIIECSETGYSKLYSRL